MNYHDIDKAVNEMNQLGSKLVPFLFGFDFELKNAFLIKNPLTQKDILFRTPDAANYELPANPGNADLIIRISDFIGKDDYRKGFESVMRAIERGDVSLCNYTIRTPVQINASFQELFMRTDSLFGLCYYNDFVSFSPERFVRISDGIISSNPMKGTIDAGLPDAENILLRDFKEDREHNATVDLIKSDLKKVASGVKLKRFKYIDHIKTNSGQLLQMSSEVTGELSAGYLSHLGDIIFSMLPAGSVSGAPKQAALQLIKSVEKQKRGYYTGIFGYFDGKTLDSAVLIRFIEREGDKIFYRSGGGITINSFCEQEYREAVQKIYIPV